MDNKTINSEWIITMILWFFLWMFWLHRFYNWKIGTWILMIFTFWWLWIWWLIDWIMLVLWKFTTAENKFLPVWVEEKKDKSEL